MTFYQKYVTFCFQFQGSYAIMNVNFPTYLDFTFQNDIPRSNTGTILLNTMKENDQTYQNKILSECMSKDHV